MDLYQVSGMLIPRKFESWEPN